MTVFPSTRNDSAGWLWTGGVLAVGLGLLPGPAMVFGIVPAVAGVIAMVMKRPAFALLPAIVFCPFNFESLIARIGIPFVNPFNFAWLGAAMALLVVSRQDHFFSWSRTPLDRFLVFNITITTVSVIQAWQIIPGSAFMDHFLVYQQWLQWILFFWIVAALVRTNRDARLVTGTIALMVLVAAIFGIKDFILTRAVSGGALERSQGLFGQANYAGSFFSYYLPPLIALSLVRMNRGVKIVLVLAAIVGTVACVVTFSRGGMLALAVAGMTIILQNRSKTLISVAIISLFIIASTPSVKDRFAETTQSTGSSDIELDDSSGARLIAWEKAMDLAKQKPIFGHGFYAFRHVHHELDLEAAAKFGHGSMDVHNGHLNTLVSSGLVGSIALYLQFGGIFFWCQRLRRTLQNPFSRALAIGLSGTVVAILISNLTGTRMYDRQLMAYLWILAGVLHALARIEIETAPRLSQ